MIKKQSQTWMKIKLLNPSGLFLNTVIKSSFKGETHAPRKPFKLQLIFETLDLDVSLKQSLLLDSIK